MSSATSTFPSTSAWSQNIWSSKPNGTVRNNSETGRLQPRPAPLARPSVPSVNRSDDDDNGTGNSEKITGSGSLLSTSEVDSSSRHRWASVGTASAPMTGARTLESSASPLAQRSAQIHGSNSSFFPSQPTAVGQTSAPQTSCSMLDPTSQTFTFSGAVGLYSPFSPNGGQQGQLETGEDRRPSQGQIQFGALSYSGQSSRAVSRNGSLPPSRHGNELPSHFDSFAAQQASSHAVSGFSHRQNQPSRNSNFSSASHSRNADYTWQPNLHDLPAAFGRMSLDRGAVDPLEPGILYDDGQYLEPENAWNQRNGRANGSHYGHRHGSAPSETDTAPAAATKPGLNPRIPHQLSPGSNTSHQSLNSPQIFTDNTMSLGDHSRTPSSASNAYRHPSPHTLADNPAWVDRRLQRIQQQQAHTGFLQNQVLQQLQRGGVPFNPSAFGNIELDAQQRLNLPGQFLPSLPGGGYGSFGQAPLNLLPPQMFPRAPPRGPAKEEAQERLRSPLLEAFKDKNNQKRWELRVSDSRTSKTIKAPN